MSATNPERLQSIVLANAAGQPFLQEFQHFHRSVKQKLWSIEYLYNEIVGLKPEIFYDQRTQGNTLVQDQSPNRRGFGLYANPLVDGFVMNTTAALDTFAHEVKVLYRFHRVPREVHVHIIENSLVRDHPHSAITTYLSDELAKQWFATFAVYTYCTAQYFTHSVTP